MNEYLGFGKRGSAQIKYIKWKGDDFYIGEVDVKDKANGRYIDFFTYGDFRLGRSKDGDYAAGPLIYIYKSGAFLVGEVYIAANGELRDRYT